MFSVTGDRSQPAQATPLGLVIRQRRRELGITQAELARRMPPGTSPRHIQRLETSGVVMPS
jgi:predicted transcriptional regulator